MRQIKIFHSITLIMMVAYGMISARRLDRGAIIFWVLVVGYLVLILGVFRGTKSLLKLSVIPPALFFLATAPNVLLNIFAFISGHSLYKDSPRTIIVVGILAICVTLPSGLVLATYWKQRKLIFTGEQDL